ncbi:hypothetical protein M5K25_013529 [Dendrobium thyrsiflorum]|uniref:Uncharacterized protein n=1 Tax=Dendrobium thyrsiflorum TaxID=117978 RepID=A0ABD0V012_DENTH
MDFLLLDILTSQLMVHAVAGRGTCPLTCGFAAKWHRRINGYDPGPSEPGNQNSDHKVLAK